MTTTEQLATALRDLLNEYDEESGTIDVGADPFCSECTQGQTPSRFDKGACPLHRAFSILHDHENPAPPPQRINGGLSALLIDLYESEINARISWFYDSGFAVEIGDEMNGIKEKVDHIYGTSGLEFTLICLAVKHYPDSAFGKAMRRE
ncbi:hypothetical protein HBA54_28095 [Pelagibius litoralis]|uniref:Uncharacterized protein n=1 Tax=Pelagibius litoralis TaxID=374515 RepID=A0A967F3S6_9PROT|nr:hypothetical protein [Pelagibius litoralis]NIA72454.1 hypothetical protein [Pelagibius litoralis]